MPTERTVEHPDGRVERITESTAAPTVVERRGGSGMGAIVALIIGLLAVLLARIDGLNADELAVLDLPTWFDQLGLARQLSPSRANGLNAVLQRMRELAKAPQD